MKEKVSILIVDDNMSQCRTMAFILKRKGYAVTTAQNGPEAIAIVEKGPFDIIFMDIKMPLMNGVETYKKIKTIRPEARVMMMTAYAVEDLVREALQEGAYGIVYKPLDIEKVERIVEKATETGQGALIMVVDDEPELCSALKELLIRKGYRVGIAHNGEKAIATAREKTFDIIFIDLKLPTLNGLETYLAIKEINPEVVAVMMTGYHQEMSDLVKQALQNNAYTCLYKPINMSDLLNLTAEIVEKKQSGK
jgi:two-component system response regulator HydG